MVVSRSWGKKPCALGSPKDSSAVVSSGKGGASGPRVVVVIDVGGRVDGRLLVMIVKESSGMLSFFVKRIEALDAVAAERRARRSGGRGMRRFMVLFSTADWIVYASKIVSCRISKNRALGKGSGFAHYSEYPAHILGKRKPNGRT